LIPALRKLRQEDKKLEDNLGYIARFCLKNKTKKKSYGIQIPEQLIV
jgi:hypothetical protein